MKKRNIDKIPRGHRKPKMEIDPYQWAVHASEVAGRPLRMLFADEEGAKRHADWWHTHPGIVNVSIEFIGEAPALVPKQVPSKADQALGESLAMALEESKLHPVVRHDITRWLDSKAWGHTAHG